MIWHKLICTCVSFILRSRTHSHDQAYEQLNALLRFLYNRETAKDGGSSSKAAGSDALSQIFGWFNTTLMGKTLLLGVSL